MSRARTAGGFILLPVVLALTLVAAVAFFLNRAAGMNTSIAARGLQADSARYVAEAGLAQINYLTQNSNCTGYTNLPATAFGADSFVATVNPKAGKPVNLTATATTTGGAVATLTRSNVAVYHTPTTVTLQSAASTTETYLHWTSRNHNFGLANSVLVQSAVASGLVKFDVSSIPANSKITAGTLQLSKSNGTFFSGTIVVYRVTMPWTEGTKTGSPGLLMATYNTAGLLPWLSAGGDYDPAPVATLTNIMQGWNSWDVTSLVQGWSDGSYPNHGMILIPTTISVLADFVSSDDSGAVAPFYPKLVLAYTTPC